MKFAKIGAVLYIIWGLLHIVAAFQGFQLGASLEPGLVRGKINQGAWSLFSGYWQLFSPHWGSGQRKLTDVFCQQLNC